MAPLLVVTEIRAGRPTGPSIELLGLARRLAGDGVGPAREVAAVAFGPHATFNASELIAHGADRVFVVGDADLLEFDSDRWCAALASITREIQPELVLLGHTPCGSDVAPRLAFRVGGAVASGCTEITREGGCLLFTRTCYGANARELLRLHASPAVATLRSGSCDGAPVDRSRSGTVVTCAVPGHGRSRVVARQRDSGEAVRLEDARVVLAGGRGVNGPEGFGVLQALASSLGGAVGASRVACDLGWCPKSWQIGLTGKSVAPELYIAAGISGASHHMAGCGSAKVIVAINSDPDAPIFRQARYGVVGDCVEIIRAITAALSSEVRVK
jgi:electron transfer flavoprotein alpha subunit